MEKSFFKVTQFPCKYCLKDVLNFPFDKLRDHPSRASGTTLREPQGPAIAEAEALEARVGVKGEI
jgi:hypothetical protein